MRQHYFVEVICIFRWSGWDADRTGNINYYESRKVKNQALDARNNWMKTVSGSCCLLGQWINQFYRSNRLRFRMSFLLNGNRIPSMRHVNTKNFHFTKLFQSFSNFHCDAYLPESPNHYIQMNRSNAAAVSFFNGINSPFRTEKTS